MSGVDHSSAEIEFGAIDTVIDGTKVKHREIRWRSEPTASLAFVQGGQARAPRVGPTLERSQWWLIHRREFPAMGHLF